ncbi:actin-like protein arp8 [Stylosanthes scabra]|uniref:Actin-like protein arp8 n=1 Tax=Stylosanthes scabra TaxID=79078 RepID=A0ABU6QCW3_9FABA|nr:actin-like protein arp8 [Stylosanthes scabra]
MSMVLRRVWELVSRSNADGSSSEELSQSSSSCSSDMGELEKLPGDIVIQIIRVLGPKEAAKLCCVCKTLRCLLLDNRLWIHFLQTYQSHPSWDSLFFAETTLSYGYPLPLPPFHAYRHQLSFKHIYGQRARVPGSVIIDGGSGYCKFGWSKYASPSGRSATFLEFGNIESPMYTRLRHFFATIYNRMQVKPNTQPVIVSVPICHYDDTKSAKASRRQLKEAIYSALFDMNVPAVCAVNQATLALFAAKRTSGIAVNIGFQVTSVVPIFNGKVMRSVGVEVVGLGALKLTGFLREKMRLNNLNFQSLYTVRTLKEKLCYVALDYEAELSKDTQASFEAVGEGRFTLSKERFQTGEILFQPHLAGVQAMGLHQAIALCMEHCHSGELAGDSDWYKTVVLSGGSACLPGLAERLEKELKALLPPYISNGTRVIPPPYGADTPWFGAKIIGNLSTFPGPWCVTKKQFRQKPRLNLIW